MHHAIRPIVFLLLLGLAWATGQRAEAQTSSAPASSGQARSEVSQPSVELQGHVRAQRRAWVASPLSGLLVMGMPSPGTWVEAQELIGTLDSELERQSLAVAHALTQEAEAQVQEAQRRLTEATELTLQLLPANEKKSRAAALTVAQALLSRRRAEEAKQAILVEQHSLRAPFSGVLLGRNKQAGEWVSAGAALMEVADLSQLRLEWTLPPDAPAALRSGSWLELRWPGSAEPVRLRLQGVLPPPSNASGEAKGRRMAWLVVDAQQHPSLANLPREELASWLDQPLTARWLPNPNAP